MKLKVIIGITLTLFLVGMLTLAFSIQPVEASGTIYIRAGGSIDGPANITTVDYVTYYFNESNYDEIVVERDNIILDGAGYTLQGNRSGTGIDLTGRSSVTIRNINIKGFSCGIYLYYSSNNGISGNSIANNSFGILLGLSSNYNAISGNNITANNYYGIGLSTSSNNTISGNNIANNLFGIRLESSSNNAIFHNNFVNNVVQVSTPESVNVWDDGYPSGGNHWSDYTDVDEKSGPNQVQLGSDGIWDHPYVIDENNQDNYPIVPEFPTWTSMLLVFVVLTVIIAIYKRRLNKTPIH